MALGTRQTNLFAAEDWKKLYTTFSEADFQSYDFETIRKIMVDYLKTYYAEDFNDFTESSEYIALLDLIAFVAQGLAFRTDLNARENFLETAERRDSVIKLVKQLSYNPARNRTAQGLLKIQSVITSEQLISPSGAALDRVAINWNDPGNPDWYQQFTQVMNAALSSSQRIGKPYASKTINGIKTDQYNIAVPSSIVPVFSYTAPVLEANAPFEVVNATIMRENAVTEQDPGVKGQFGVIYQQDGRGFASARTGFFMMFKQGQLQSLDFSIADRLPNRIVSVPVDNINDNDVWLYEMSNGNISTQWTPVDGTKGSNAIYNNSAKGIRSIYSVNSRLNDQIDLVFSDGTFGEIPQGAYRVYFRVSNGVTYRISPGDMTGVSITIPYISRSGRSETLTVIANLQYTVANSSRRDLLYEIKNKAPQSFYTQNRMVNGEDYNIFPYTRYSDIVKIKSVNRFSSGISRSVNAVDPTGKYSSTDIFSDDGAVYKEEFVKNLVFTFNTRNEATSAVKNLLQPLIQKNSFKHFYYERYPDISLSAVPTYWSRITDDTTSCTGFFANATGDKQQIGEYTSTLRKYLLKNSLIKFEAPVGYYFDINNVLLQGTPSLLNDKTYIWATVKNQTGNGTNSIYFGGREIGSITLSENIPSNAVVTEVYAPLSVQFSNNLIITMTNLIFNKIDFALRYDYTATPLSTVDPWKIITAANLDRTGDFSLSNTGSTSSTGIDASWLFKLETDGSRYTITYRGLSYIYASQNKVRFLNSNPRRTYDSSTNTFIKDNVKILKVNSKPSSTSMLDKDVIFEIYENLVENDGYVDNSKVLVTYADANDDGIIDDPTLFSQISDSATANVFFKKYFDFDNLVRYQLLSAGTVNISYSTLAQIELNKLDYASGKVFYASTDDKFYIISLNGSAKTVTETTDYLGYRGRQDLYFQYKHNASESSRIDPATTNLIDMYILNRNYDEAYRNYILDNTGTVAKPTDLNPFELAATYSDLFDYKMVSDSLIINPGKYKPLFGTKAQESLQATLQIVKGISTTISDNELKSKVVAAINDYFSLSNWEFGDTFYFSELSAYLHSKLGGDIGSIILVPNDTNAVFGSLYEIRCQPNEIFISAATVDNIQITTGVLVGINNSGVTTTTLARGITY
jgi:hypothetical protein